MGGRLGDAGCVFFWESLVCLRDNKPSSVRSSKEPCFEVHPHCPSIRPSGPWTSKGGVFRVHPKSHVNQRRGFRVHPNGPWTSKGGGFRVHPMKILFGVLVHHLASTHFCGWFFEGWFDGCPPLLRGGS